MYEIENYSSSVTFSHQATGRWRLQQSMISEPVAAWLDGRTSQARRWFGWARHRLHHGQPAGVLADLAEAWEVEGWPDTARDPLATVSTYLARHRDYMDYQLYKEGGLPLGSGMMESACKGLIHQRFKRVGMR